MVFSLSRLIPLQLRRVLLIAFLTRIAALFFFFDSNAGNYWEYGQIARNILDGHGYSLSHPYTGTTTPYPSSLMSPGYTVIVLPFIALHNVVFAHWMLVSLQLIVSLVTIVPVYHFTANRFSPEAGLFTALIAALLPDYVYAFLSITPTVLYHLGVICLLIIIQEKDRENAQENMLPVGFLCAALTYLRSEFLLYTFLVSATFLFRGKWKEGIVIAVVTIGLLLPWAYRNYATFGSVIPLNTGFGINLYRGNNPEEIGSWGNDTTNAELLRLPRDQRFEVAVDSLYRTHAIAFIEGHPMEEVMVAGKKIFHLWFFSTLQKRSLNALYAVSSLLTTFFFIIGIAGTWSWEKHKFIYLFLLYSTFLAALFFVLPRHQTMMRIGVLPLAGAGMDIAWRKLRASIHS